MEAGRHEPANQKACRERLQASTHAWPIPLREVITHSTITSNQVRCASGASSCRLAGTWHKYGRRRETNAERVSGGCSCSTGL